MKPRILDIFKFVIGWPLSLLAIFFIIRLLLPNITEVKGSLTELNFFLLLISIVCFLGYYLSRTLLWHFLIRATGIHIPLRETVYLWSISEANRYIPGNVWSFLSRSVKFREKKVENKAIAASLLQETLFVLAGAAVIFLFSIPFLKSINAISTFIAKIPDLLLIGIILGSVVALILQGILLWRIKFLRKFFSENSYTPSQTALFFLVSFIGLFFFGFGYYFAISSVVALPAKEFFTISSFAVVSLLIGYLSFITPAGLGVREGFLTVGLASFMTVPLAGFAALFARIILITAEVLFVALAKAWSSHKLSFLEKLEAHLKADSQKVVLTLAVIAYSIYVSVASLARYDNFNTGRFDLGNMVQTVWNTSQGRIFELSDPNGIETVSRLAFHSDYILVLFAPVYALIPHPGVLLVSQAVIVAIGAFFIYGISNIMLKNRWASLFIALAYLINPSIIRANLYDFHAVVLATTFLLGAWYYYLKKRFLLMSVFLVLAGITKEQVWAVVALFGFYVGLVEIFRNLRKKKFSSVLQNKTFFWGIGIFISGLIIFYTTITYLIPGARGGNEHFALEFYGKFGSSPKELVINILESPQEILWIAVSPDRLEYLKMLFQPLGYLPLLSPAILVFIIPDLLINLLSSNPNFQQIYYQYTAVITPFLFIAAIYSIAFLNKTFPKLKINFLAAYLFFAAIYGTYLYGPLPGSKNPNTGMFDEKTANREEIAEYLKTIPHTASVAATNNAGSHLSEREFLTTLPIGIYDTEYVVFMVDGNVGQDLKHKENIVRLLNNPNYILLKKLDNFYVFGKLPILVPNY